MSLAERSQIAHVVGEALQFEPDGRAAPGRERRLGHPSQGLRAPGSRLSHDRWPCRRRSTRRRSGAGRVRSREKSDSAPRCWYPSRISRCKTVLAAALEPEMTGFDDAGVHRSHRHLVDARALDAEKATPMTVAVRHHQASAGVQRWTHRLRATGALRGECRASRRSRARRAALRGRSGVSEGYERLGGTGVADEPVRPSPIVQRGPQAALQARRRLSDAWATRPGPPGGCRRKPRGRPGARHSPEHRGRRRSSWQAAANVAARAERGRVRSAGSAVGSSMR